MPSAVLVSFDTHTLASLHVSFSIAWFSESKSEPSAGYRPENTMCFAGLKPESEIHTFIICFSVHVTIYI